MAFPFVYIPVLTGEVAEEFNRQAEYNAKYLTGSEYSAEREAWCQKIIENSRIAQQTLKSSKWNFQILHFSHSESPSENFSPQNNLGKIAAAFTVANTCLFTRMLPNSRKKKVGYEVRHSKGPINYPAVLLGQLGVDANFAGRGLGQQIIEFVAQWFSSRENKSGCRYLIVEAYNEERLLSFYASCGLKPVFNDIEQERIYRHLDDGKPLETRLLYRDLILFKRKSIRS